uniref:Putative downstream of tyrosine kinase 1 n=1 Tax=Panstrongylus megistus TaxID=65343 RepID=A0A069DYW5_9HEMI
MAVKLEAPLKEGYLLIPPQGVIGLKKKWQRRFCQLFPASICGIERLEIYENEEDTLKNLSVPIVTLENCVKITQDIQKSQPHSFTVVTKTSVHHFAGTSDEDCLDWISAFQRVAFQDTISRRTVEEDNELYSPSSDGVYRVTLVSSEASQRCGLTPGVEYTLVVAPSELQLKQPESQDILFTWPYRFIRRYGHKRGRFTFEAGRKCDSGEGSFDFEHAHAQEIFRCTTNKMENMKQLLSIKMDGCSGGLLLGDFAPALSMTARSRSPLAPSPTGSTTVVPSIVPAKPPRKHPPPSRVQPSYDTIEVRREAWRTFGTDELTHTERTFPSTGVFTQDSTTSQGDYDKLDHFGSTAKLDIEPGYSTILRNNPSDSTAGYGVIRKLRPPNHTIYNDMEYAVVCKPHQV